MKELSNFAMYVKNASSSVSRLEDDVKYGKGPTRKRAIDSLIYTKKKLQQDMVAFAKLLDTPIQKDELLYAVEQ